MNVRAAYTTVKVTPLERGRTLGSVCIGIRTVRWPIQFRRVGAGKDGAANWRDSYDVAGILMLCMSSATAPITCCLAVSVGRLSQRIHRKGSWWRRAAP